MRSSNKKATGRKRRSGYEISIRVVYSTTRLKAVGSAFAIAFPPLLRKVSLKVSRIVCIANTLYPRFAQHIPQCFFVPPILAQELFAVLRINLKISIPRPCNSLPFLAALGLTQTIALSALQQTSMMIHVVFDEALDKPVGVIVSGMAAQGKLLSRFRRCCLQGLRMQLRLQELIAQPLIDQNFHGQRVAVQQPAGIPLGPFRFIRTEVMTERLGSPGHRTRIADRRKCRDRAEAARITKRESQRAVAPIEWPKIPCQPR